MTGERKYYPALDIAKFVMAVLILMQHTSNEWAHSTGLVHAFFGLGNFAVPFFFACSGFLFFSKIATLNKSEQKAYYFRWSKRIALMYLVWSLIYFFFVLWGWWIDGFPKEKILNFIHRTLVYSTYATIWFLPALWVGVTLCFLLFRYFPRWLVFCALFLLMAIGNLFGSYINVLSKTVEGISRFNDCYLSFFVTWRNGVFNGAPYVAIGSLFAFSIFKMPSIRKAIPLALLFSALFICEAYAIVRYNLSSATDQGFMLAPSIFFLMAILIQVKVPDKGLFIHLRNWSMLIFLGQRLFLSALPGVFPGMGKWISGLSEVGIYLYFLIVVLIFSILLEGLSNRIKFLKILW